MMFLTILTLVLAGNSNAFLSFWHFEGLKGQYTSKLLLGLAKKTKNKGFYMHKKNYKNATNEISNNEKKRFFGIFRLG